VTAVAHASRELDVAGAAPGEGKGRSDAPMTRSAMSVAMQMSASSKPARTRDPTPAMVYENTTSSGVSTSTVCASDESPVRGGVGKAGLGEAGGGT